MRFSRRFLRYFLSLGLCLPNAAASGQAAADQEAADQAGPGLTAPRPPVPSLPERALASPELSFDSYVQLLAARARGHGVSEGTIQRMTAGLMPNPRIIELDRAQPGQANSGGFASMAAYLSKHINSSLIYKGKSLGYAMGPLGRQIEERYGVPLPMVIAIFGHETNYGSYSGDFDLARSLATLAWEGRRRELFADEFIALLRLADRGMSRERLRGSWAGALGNPQFLPSVYLRLGVDGDGDGTSDIWSSRADTIASIANYFRDAGWRTGQPWGVAADVPVAFDRSSVKARMASPVCPRVHERHSRWMSIAEWRDLGIAPRDPIGDDVQAALFEPDGPGKNAYLLTGNYRVILEYNCSNYYALSVGLLADEIAR